MSEKKPLIKAQCRMKNGKIYDYHACDHDRNNRFYNPTMRYIGYGEVYAMNGKVTGETKMLHFWQERA